MRRAARAVSQAVATKVTDFCQRVAYRRGRHRHRPRWVLRRRNGRYKAIAADAVATTSCVGSVGPEIGSGTCAAKDAVPAVGARR